ncbi:MAG: long-subunit acyl-CoA synthetase (AMP-forming) [Oleiphilaceae bacterium]
MLNSLISKANTEAAEKLKNILIDVNNKLESHQRLDYIVVCSDVWDIDNGLLTPTLKIKRKLILLMVFSFMIIKIPQTY